MQPGTPKYHGMSTFCLSKDAVKRRGRTAAEWGSASETQYWMRSHVSLPTFTKTKADDPIQDGEEVERIPAPKKPTNGLSDIRLKDSLIRGTGNG